MNNFIYFFCEFSTVMIPNCDLSTTPEALFVAIFKMAVIFDTQKIYHVSIWMSLLSMYLLFSQ